MSPELNRRDWMMRCLQAASVLAALPGNSEAAGAWKPQCLNANQNATLVAIGEAIVPGSAAASCNQVIDHILSIESESNQASLKSALDAFSHFSSQTPEQQGGTLSAASIAGNQLEPHFQLIKEWIAATYWSSEHGLKELGWNGQMAWANFPGCESHH